VRLDCVLEPGILPLWITGEFLSDIDCSNLQVITITPWAVKPCHFDYIWLYLIILLIDYLIIFDYHHSTIFDYNSGVSWSIFYTFSRNWNDYSITLLILCLDDVINASHRTSQTFTSYSHFLHDLSTPSLVARERRLIDLQCSAEQNCVAFVHVAE